MTRVLLLVALAACSIQPIDYTGKACPCPEDYECDLLTNTCAKELIADARTDTRLPDSMVTPPGDSCLVNPKTNLVYSSVGFADFPQGWLGASGQWSKEGGEVKQINAANPLAWLSHSPGNNNANYRVVATMRFIDGLDDAGFGIAFRVSGLQGNMYTCTIAPRVGRLELDNWQQGVTVVLSSRDVVINPPETMLTMEINVDAATMSCCLRNDSNATITAMNGIWTSGYPGVVTTDAEAAFGSFWIYQ